MSVLRSLTRPLRWLVMVPLLRLLRAVAQGVPEGVLMWCGRRLGAVAFFLFRRERARALDNLAHAFPEKPEDERLRIARASFRHFAEEFMALLASGAERTRAQRARLLNPDDFDLLIKKSLRTEGEAGTIYVTAHLGNWEILGGIVSLSEGNFRTFARRMKSPALEHFISGIRAANGMEVIYTDEPPVNVIRQLRRGASFSILPDQDIPEIDGFFVPFFGRSAWTPAAPARLALAGRTDIRAVFLVREGRSLRLLAGESILPDSDSTDPTDAMVRLTLRWTRELEAAIRAYPEQWCWMHDRWRSTPERILRRRGRAPVVADETGRWHIPGKEGADA